MAQGSDSANYVAGLVEAIPRWMAISTTFVAGIGALALAAALLARHHLRGRHLAAGTDSAEVDQMLKVDAGEMRRLGSTFAMLSAVSAITWLSPFPPAVGTAVIGSLMICEVLAGLAMRSAPASSLTIGYNLSLLLLGLALLAYGVLA